MITALGASFVPPLETGLRPGAAHRWVISSMTHRRRAVASARRRLTRDCTLPLADAHSRAGTIRDLTDTVVERTFRYGGSRFQVDRGTAELSVPGCRLRG